MSNRVENTLSQLIKMVGTIQSDQQEMKQELLGIKQEQQGMKQEMLGLKQEQQTMKQEMKETKQEIQSVKTSLHNLEVKSEERHQEVLARFKTIEYDQDFIWEKTARNEREISHIKKQLT